MMGTTLAEIGDHVDAIASHDGEYYVVCGRTGERPVPVAGKRFDGRSGARSAARAAEQYRRALRRYDPQVPHHDLIVCQDAGPPSGSPGRTRRSTGSVGTGDPPGPERRRLVEFCHDAAAAVFETLADGGHDGVETAVVDAYFDLAETVPDPDDLRLCLLESTARELDRRLSPPERAAVLAGAAARLAPPAPTRRPVATALSALRDRGLVGGEARARWSVAPRDGTRSAVVRFSEYALAPREGRLPVLPIVLELYRHRPEWSPTPRRAVDLQEGWRLTLVPAGGGDPDGFARVPVAPEV